MQIDSLETIFMKCHKPKGSGKLKKKKKKKKKTVLL